MEASPKGKRKKHGGVHNIKEYDSILFLSKFDLVRQYLLKDPLMVHERDSKELTNRGLASLHQQLIQFMEDNLGRYSQLPRSMTRIPVALFHDYAPGGSLCTIISTCWAFRRDNDWRQFYFQSPVKRDKNLEMFLRIESELLKSGFMKKPQVFFSNVLSPETVEKLKGIVATHGGQIVENQSDATHIIEPNNEDLESTGEEYLRTLEKKEKHALVHWWFHPDSYDEWLPISEVEGDDPEPIENRSGAWVVGMRWITDLSIFNEWMNEEDYLIETGDTEPSNSQQGLSSSQKNKSKRKRDVEEMASPVKKQPNTKQDWSREVPDPVEAVDLAPTSAETKKDPQRQASKEEEEDVAISSQNQTGDEKQSGLIPAEESTKDTGNGIEDAPPKSPNAMDTVDQADNMEDESQRPSSPVHKIVINVPAHSSWFSLEKISDIERRALPEFFNHIFPSKNEAVYQEYRNFMISKWRSNPTDYLTVTECRRSLVGDAFGISRVHAFLEQWGLINRELQGARPAYADERSQIVIHHEGGEDSKVHDTEDKQAPSNLHLRRNLFTDLQPKDIPSIQYHCNKCNVDCTSSRYHCQVQADFDLCVTCFLKKHYPVRMTPADFIRMDAGAQKAQHESGWTEQETLLLLEAVEMFKHDWDEIATHVGTKNKQQCILHFIGLPIEDPYLEDELLNIGINSTAQKGIFGGSIPFTSSTNPVMSTVAFLAGVVDPRVAAAAAKAAADAFRELADQNGTNKKDTASDENLQIAAATGLAVTSVKASLMANQEEKELVSLMATVLESQMKKIELRMSHFEQLEALLEKEKEQVESMRHQLFAERLALRAAANQVDILPLVIKPDTTTTSNSTTLGEPTSAPTASIPTASTVPAIPLMSTVTPNATGPTLTNGPNPVLVQSLLPTHSHSHSHAQGAVPPTHSIYSHAGVLPTGSARVGPNPPHGFLVAGSAVGALRTAPHGGMSLQVSPQSFVGAQTLQHHPPRMEPTAEPQASYLGHSTNGLEAPRQPPSNGMNMDA
eukprot:TRINITY_DN9453_c0_g1_i1.p1 TRINITY_DN9453_c0_g1~~TRINITY_DN9453_c0_g1_i1.p1  ORF type:complete len:1018 (+),score=223.35 TRINITY_DN9453_c0_g1_i1:86-3139(+)